MINSLSFICFNIKIINDIRYAKGINFGAIPNKLRNEYLKYVVIGYPLSTISSRKFTALTVNAIKLNPNTIVKKVLKISIKKFW